MNEAVRIIVTVVAVAGTLALGVLIIGFVVGDR